MESLNNGPWKVNLLANTKVTSATDADFGNLKIVIPVLSTTDRFLVTFNGDCSTINKTSSVLVGRLWVAGIEQAEQVVLRTAGAQGRRDPASRTWIVSGLPVGNQVFKITMLSNPASGYSLWATHTALEVARF